MARRWTHEPEGFVGRKDFHSVSSVLPVAKFLNQKSFATEATEITENCREKILEKEF